MSLFGWDYPPGCENDPDAPWNQKEEQCLETKILDLIKELTSSISRGANLGRSPTEMFMRGRLDGLQYMINRLYQILEEWREKE